MTTNITNTYKSKVRKFGSDNGTLFVHIPKAIADNLGLEKADDVLITIQKNEPKLYRCKRCQHEFSLEFDDNKICPACDCDSISEVFE